METDKTAAFTHRPNSDGTVDSICRNCFATVATDVSDAALARRESAHVCDTYQIARFRPQGGLLPVESTKTAS